MAMKLKIGNDIAFDVLFSVNDGGKQKDFGFRVEALRAGEPEATATVGHFLAAVAKVRMVAWVGDEVLLCDDAGQPVPAGPEALQALYDLVPNMPGLVYVAYRQAIGAKARLGN